jgi:hypothetical protein
VLRGYDASPLAEVAPLARHPRSWQSCKCGPLLNLRLLGLSHDREKLMIRVFTAAPLFLIAVAPAGAQYLHHYNIGPPNPQQVIMEQRYQDAISRNAANRLLDQMSPPRPMIDPGVRYGSGTVIVVPDVSTRRLRASQSKRQVSARGKRKSPKHSAF